MIKYSSYGITFDGKGEWRYGNDYAIFLILGEGDTFGINGSFGAPEKKFSINFSKANTKVGLSLHIMLITVVCLLMEKKSLNLKLTIKMLTFQLNFVSNVFLTD